MAGRPSGAYVRTLHKKRLQSVPIDIKGNSELEAAWHNLQLHWLETVPGYREEIKKRVSTAAKKAELYSTRTDNYYAQQEYRENFSCD